MSRAPLQVPRLPCPPLVLRPFAPTDAPLVVEASSDPYITATTTVPADPSPREVQAFLERQHERARSGQGWSLAIDGRRRDVLLLVRTGHQTGWAAPDA